MFASVPASAQVTVNPTRAAMKIQRQQNRETLRKTNADAEITRRVTALNNLISVISAMKRISAGEKTTLTGNIQNEISTLDSLKAKIDADTDPATLQADKQSIVTSYRVFLVFMPQVRITAMADKVLDLAALLQTKSPSSDATAKINDAISQANAAIAAVANLNPGDWPNNQSTIQGARTDVRTAYQDLKDAWSIMKK
ncbi:MAG TPA: hypothetical protein VMT55_06460 [Candidatus Sulfotelmatobacter sp.]|nr:hypothetical protein [Candidatus Sulfotelmatobacter sp.]